MTSSHKKSSLWHSSSERVLPQSARSTSSKKSSSASHKKSTETDRARSASRKKPQRDWDSTNHDLSVHKLAPKKMLEKQLQMMSKETLCKIAGIEPPNRPAFRPVIPPTDDVLSPLSARKRHTRESFTSPASSNGDANSSVVSTTPDSSRRAHDDDSVSSTPSPATERGRRPRTAVNHLASKSHTIVHQAVPSQKKKTTAAAAPVVPLPAEEPISNPIIRRRSAAPTTTAAPPQTQEEPEEPSYLAFLASSTNSTGTSAASSSAAGSSVDLTYSTWLKQDSFLSPVLERSIEASTIASTPAGVGPARSPSIDRRTSSDAAAPLLSPGEQHEAEHGRNLLHELRQSIEHMSASQRPSTSEAMHVLDQDFASSALVPLLTRLASHLSERPERAAKEQQFKATVVDSFAQAAAQVKSLQARVEAAESENRAMKALLASQKEEHARAVDLMTQHLTFVEAKMDQVMASISMVPRQAPAYQTQPQSSPSTHDSSAYDPSLYHSARSGVAPSLPHHQPSGSNPRASSPPRPVVIGHAPNRTAAPQVQGQRLSEVAVQLASGPNSARQHGNRTISSAQVTVHPQSKAVPWQTYHHQQQQQQSQQTQPQPAQSRPNSARLPPAEHPSASIQPAHSSHLQSTASAGIAAAPASFRASFNGPASGASGATEDTGFLAHLPFDDSQPFTATPYSRAALAHMPLSPGEMEEAAEAARFERERQAARARMQQRP